MSLVRRVVRLLPTDLARSDVAYIECLETCWLREHRHCTKVPDKCGECLSSYVLDVNGICQPINERRMFLCVIFFQPELL